jgi:hypothetical protein
MRCTRRNELLAITDQRTSHSTSSVQPLGEGSPAASGTLSSKSSRVLNKTDSFLQTQRQRTRGPSVCARHGRVYPSDLLLGWLLGWLNGRVLLLRLRVLLPRVRILLLGVRGGKQGGDVGNCFLRSPQLACGHTNQNLLFSNGPSVKGKMDAEPLVEIFQSTVPLFAGHHFVPSLSTPLH